ncbi:choice-of-anchor L domain-containing protein [Flavobacterium sedimenticola]|uniref:Choice-of-anchor L domain-containing protein n=1 Tax=Flavobacterium sedimenticola TaxID=3043286 RepID=A0ABT6XNP0_9FLAO|nr:choice-of-anchor L domain-containing protein [Flavobacterium sedimenticola]MDI9256709.1 choice-of-anchor L domain-containing protein [Flavobacterium sedimenticola]
MKKITLLLLASFFSISGFAQMATECFESTTGPNPLPSTTWTLGTGNWAVFDNGVGLGQRWGINSTVASPPIVYEGTNAAYVNRENIGQGNTSEDYLATPLVTIPANGEMHFFTRSFATGNQGTLYQIKVAPGSASQTNPAAYSTLVQQWTEADLTATFNIYEEKIVDLSAFAGQQVYVSFVKVFTQPGTTLDGDRWLIDCVSINSKCLTPTGLTFSGVTQNGASLNWLNPSGATSWEIEIVASPGTPTGVGTVYNGTLPYVVTGLQPNTSYTFYVKALCDTGYSSEWSTASGSFTTSAAPPECGGNFVDAGGTTGNYPNNSDSTVTICPTIPGEQVTVTFTSFNTETNWDALYVFDGNSIAAPQIASANGAGNVPGGLAGGFWGTAIPGPFTSSSPDGCLTFRFRSDASFNNPGWIANVTCAPPPVCQQPTALTATTITSNSVSLGWTNVGIATSWEVLALPCGSPAPTAASTGWQAASTNPFTITGLSSATCYDLYVRGNCGTDGVSLWAGPRTITTQVSPPVCGGNFVDPGGPAANYPNNSDSTVTICPTIPGELVTVTFTSFNTEATWDALYVFDGNSIAAPQIASANGAGNVPGGLPGGYWGTAIPGPFTSSSPDGCLTFRFRSDGFVNNPGWIANITCAPAPACQQPTGLTATNVTSNAATLGWTNVGAATSWEVLALPCGSPAPTAGSTGWVPTTSNPFVITGLNPTTCYDLYVRGNCGVDGVSTWAGPRTITTQVAPPVCGGNFVDVGGPAANYPNNSDSTVTICPTVPGEQVTVTFTSFNTEANWDALYVFDGNSIAAPQIASTNPAANVPGGLPGGYWGTDIPGPFTSSSVDGCLTFRFRSDGSVNNPGWIANVTCNPPPTCPRPTAVAVSAITQNGATVSWTEIGSATSWQVLFLPASAPAPDATTPGWVTANTNPFTYNGLNSGTQYKVYVRSFCSDSDISLWSNPVTFATLISNDECSNAINVPVNPDTDCVQFASGTVIGATASTEPNTCGGTDDDDVWFSFVATATTHSINLTNVAGSTTDLFHVLYSGSCGSLTQLYCSDNNESIANSLTVGQTYYIRVYTWTATAGQTSTFDVCIGTIPPPISTNTNQYTITQLVEDVFLNSTCATVTNVTASTGSNFGSTNGIGYFNQNGSTFPFADGIVLTSGNALSAPGPNTTTLSDGIQAWTGDPQLEAIILAATGNPMNSRNASRLEFDFVPLVNTINFNFIFASEEYGTFQCDYSDAFAFLLTDLSTGVTTNLAVVPNTTTPVSVVTIRDQQYNNACASVNPQYFDAFYGFGGLDPLSSPTNFNGVTVPLTATSTVTPGNQYHIKLVIADRLDNAFDSAVFLEGGSLDIGNIDLGDDFLQANNTALCAGTSYTISTGLDPALYTFTWTNGTNVIPNETGPNLTINQPGVYGVSVQYINTTCSSSDSITIEYYDPFVPGTPNNLTACDNSGYALFDLSTNNASALGSLDTANYTVTYYASNADAVGEVNPHPTQYTNVTQYTETVYVRIENNITGCYEIRSFNLIVNPLNVPTFTIDTDICQNETAPVLPNMSNNGYSGTWNPAIVDNTVTGTYTFTPSDQGCIAQVTVTVQVTPTVIPTFISPAPICSGDTAPTLPATSSNGVTGTWSPAVVDNTQTATYTFTPNPGQCAATTTMSVTVYQNCAFGSFANAVWVTDCDSGEFYNTMGSGTSIIGPAQNIFTNNDFGTYISNSNTLKLRGAELKTFKSATANVCSANLYYRIYPQSGTPGAFSVINLPFFDDCSGGTFPTGGPCNTGDQKWQEVLTDAESPVDLTAFPAGDYVLEVYYDVTGDVNSTSQCDDTILINNNGANFIATYTLQNNPTYTFVNPTACTATDGSITIGNLAPSTSFSMTYTDDGSPVGPVTINSNASGSYTLNGLNVGVYTNFNFTVNGCAFSSTDVITLNAPFTVSVAGTNPVTCNSNTGSITLSSLTPNQVYTVSYTDDTANVGPLTLTADANGLIVLTGLNAGVYSNFSLSTALCSGTNTQVITLADPGAPVVTVNSASICTGQSTTITATPQTPGSYNYTWTVPTGVTNPGNVASFNTSVAGTYTVVITPIGTSFCNGSFENPTATGQFPNMLNESAVPCWDTSAADGILEVWPPAGFENVFAYQGGQFIEMNGNSIATISQDFTTYPGAQLQISFAHRGRQGNDTVGVEIGPVGGPYVSLGNFTDGNTAWVLHNLNYTIPLSGGSNYTIRFVSVSSTGGDPSVGNFLDAVTITSAECSSAPASGTVTISPAVSLNLTSSNNIQTVCVNTPIVDIVYSSANATSVSVTGLPSGVTGTYDSGTGNFVISGTPTQDGVFNYVVTTSGGCNPAAQTGTINVNATVTATFTSITICNGDAVSFPATSLEGFSGTWNPSTISNTQSATYTFTPNAGQCAASGTLTVNVTPPALPTFTQVAAICSGETLSALPTASIEGITGTWTPALNNTATTTYTFTPTAGQCAATTTMTITVNPNVTPTFNAIANVCLGEINPPTLPTTSVQGITGTWSPATIDSSTAGTFNFTFTADPGQCATNGTLSVTVLNSFDFEITESCIDDDLTLQFNSLTPSFNEDTATFAWFNSSGQVVGNSPAFNAAEYLASTPTTEVPPITFTLTVTDANGCFTTHDFIVDRLYCGIQKGISVNGDGLNDFFDLTDYNVRVLTIFNRYGMKVYSKSGYTNQWGGQSDKGDELPDGTYYYVIEFNDNQAAKTGWIYVNREQ